MCDQLPLLNLASLPNRVKSPTDSMAVFFRGAAEPFRYHKIRLRLDEKIALALESGCSISGYGRN